MAKHNEVVIPAKGEPYKNKNSNELVNVFSVDFVRSRVRYAPQGIGSGKEFELDIDAFLAEFNRVER